MKRSLPYKCEKLLKKNVKIYSEEYEEKRKRKTRVFKLFAVFFAISVFSFLLTAADWQNSAFGGFGDGGLMVFEPLGDHLNITLFGESYFVRLPEAVVFIKNALESFFSLFAV